MDGYRCSLPTTTAFPIPAGLIADLAQDGVKTVVIVDPGVKVDSDYTPYGPGPQRGILCPRRWRRAL